jgi:hypothetical protein
MDTQVERELRLALAARAAELPSDASSRLLAADYRPRSGRGRPALAAGVVALLAAVVVAVSLVGLGTQAPRAFAGWSATPTVATGDQARRAEEACRPALPTSRAIERAQETAAGRHEPWPIPHIPAGGWRTTLIDTRGPYTVVLFVASHGAAELTCLSGREGGSLSGSSSTHTPPPVPVGHIAVVSSGSRTTRPDEGSEHFSQLAGRTGPGVTSVVVRLDDGTRVRATVANGWFVAWWPGTQKGTANEVTTAKGTVIQPATPTELAG